MTCRELKRPSLRTELYLPRGGGPGGVGVGPLSSCRASAPGKLDTMRIRADPRIGAEGFMGPVEKA